MVKLRVSGSFQIFALTAGGNVGREIVLGGEISGGICPRGECPTFVHCNAVVAGQSFQGHHVNKSKQKK